MNPTAAPAREAGVNATAEAALQALLQTVQANPSRFDFFALLRRVDSLRQQHPRTGHALRPRQEGLRLGQSPDLDFAPAALQQLQWRDEDAPRLVVRFFGLLGPQGPMPLHFTEFVRERSHHHGDATLTHFLDLFHHRLLSLFYRAWAQAQPVVHLDRPHEDRYRAWLAACAGAPQASLALSSTALAFQAGWLAGSTRHPEALVKVLQQFFGVPARVEEHVGHWLPIDRADRSRLGHARNRSERSGLAAAQLGVTSNAGSRVWDRQFRFRLHLGPLSLDQYSTLLPGGSAWPALLQWLQVLAGRELQWDLELTLAADQRHAAQLGRNVRLGVLGWLGRRSDAGSSGSRARSAKSAAPRSLRMRPLTSFLTHRLGVTDV